MHDPHNKLFSLAADFIQYSNRSVFLTGKAGTGKTTFLKYIRTATHKQTAVVAPTGVAAINAGGVTIHSFFQLPFTPFAPESKGFEGNSNTINKHSLIGRIKLNRDRRQVLQQLELLIIDEISMVRCDVLDAIDAVLRHFRHRYDEPFGGVQVLFIGDMFQLPPVIPEQEWQILSRVYASAYFFDSRVIQQQPLVHIELDKIYRQNEQGFISLLNKVRNNEMDEEGYQLLNSRYQPAFRPGKEDGYITLTTHNHKADAINTEELQKLSAKTFIYKATVTGDFNEKAYPADELLSLKTGAQVMFIKNDVEKVRRFFNGKIGTISKIEEDSIFVQCKDEDQPVEVKREKWENIRYSLNQSSQQVDEEVAGTFEQFPLRLAWAITIHKSQGLTFEKAVIDAGSAFAAGQVYVALSRCTTLEGIVLKSHVTGAGLFTDPHITHFASQKSSALLLDESLEKAKLDYQISVVTSLFDLTGLGKRLNLVIKTVEEHAAAFNPETMPWLQLLEKTIENLQQTATKFQPQLQQLLADNIIPENNDALQQRIKAAGNYFDLQSQALIQQLTTSPAVTDSKQYAMAYNEDLKELFSTVCKKQYAFSSCKDGFSVDTLHAHTNSFTLPPFPVNAYAKTFHRVIDSPHPVLYKELRLLRDLISDEESLPIYIIAGSQSLDEMARFLPMNPDQLMLINGFGKAKVQKFGQRFLQVIISYCEANGLTSSIHEKTPAANTRKKPAAKTIDTKAESYKLYKEGKTISEIADARNLTVSTVEGHFTHYIKQGIIALEEIISREKLILIEPLVRNHEGGSITPIKESLGEKVSFGDIRLVLAGIEFERQKTSDS